MLFYDSTGERLSEGLLDKNLKQGTGKENGKCLKYSLEIILPIAGKKWLFAEYNYTIKCKMVSWYIDGPLNFRYSFWILTLSTGILR
ncbi:MAG: hypothetical protein K6T91_02500 [Firmicutes bacterium]|nr:hypothetical protein [Bacillota bacterium]